MNIDEMEAGRKMDALVAERVMKWLVLRLWQLEPDEDGYEKYTTRFPCMFLFEQGGWDIQRNENDLTSELWQPSSDIRAAWEVESQIEQLGLQEAYMTALWDIAGTETDYDDAKGRFAYKHASPLNICKAAVRAASAQEEGEGKR